MKSLIGAGTQFQKACFKDYIALMEKPTIIIFEGPDKVGKTTIAKKFCGLLGANYFKYHAQQSFLTDKELRPDLATSLIADFFLDFLHQVEMREVLVCDRGAPSEYVYSRALKREHLLPVEFFQQWERAHLKLANFYIVYMDANSPRLSLNDQLLLASSRDKTIENWEAIRIAYAQYFSEISIMPKDRIIKIDTSTPASPEHWVRYVVNGISK